MNDLFFIRSCIIHLKIILVKVVRSLIKKGGVETKK